MDTFAKGELPVLSLVNLPKHLTLADLKKKLSLVQGIRSVKLPMNVIKGENKGFAFLTFVCEEKALKVLTRGSIVIDGIQVTVRDMQTWHQMSGKGSNGQTQMNSRMNCTLVILKHSSKDIPIITDYFKQFGPVVGVSCSHPDCRPRLAITFKYPDCAINATIEKYHRISDNLEITCIQLSKYVRSNQKGQCPTSTRIGQHSQEEKKSHGVIKKMKGHNVHTDILYVQKPTVSNLDPSTSENLHISSLPPKRDSSSSSQILMLHKISQETQVLQQEKPISASKSNSTPQRVYCIAPTISLCYRPTSALYASESRRALTTCHEDISNFRFNFIQ